MDIKLTLDSLQEILDYESASLVRKICKRFEIIDNKSVLKAEVRELIYEEMRHVRDLLLSAGRGIEPTVIKFNNANQG